MAKKSKGESQFVIHVKGAGIPKSVRDSIANEMRGMALREVAGLDLGADVKINIGKLPGKLGGPILDGIVVNIVRNV